jgi:transposase
MRKSIDGLSALVEQEMALSPNMAALFVFCNRGRDKIQVLVHVRKKYACKHYEEGVTLAALPPQPIPKSNASPGLLAHIAVSKYQDALPLYRQQAVLQRSDVDIPPTPLPAG